MSIPGAQVAALIVDVARGPYARMPGVDPWGQARDARLYGGPHPVVAHPPCERWGNLWRFNDPAYDGKLGDDGGCFASAVASVRRWGGVLEHPKGSRAWGHFQLPPWGALGRWRGTPQTGWSTWVYLGAYGFPAPKATILWAYGVPEPRPLLTTGADCAHRVELMGKEARHITPLAFASLLVDLARSARGMGA